MEVKSVLINNSVSLNVKIHFAILILLHFISLITNNFSNNMVKVKVKQSLTVSVWPRRFQEV